MTTGRTRIETQVCILALAVVPACGGLAPGARKSGAERGASEQIHFVGRVDSEASGKGRYAWSGAGFRVRFRGTGLVVRLKDDKNEHQIVLDGAPTERIATRKGTERYVLAEGLPLGEHELALYRRTEALFGTTELLGIEVMGGELLPLSKPRRRIEIVGDSISCGYGNEGKSANCPFTASTENHYLSYGARVARALDAELSTVAWSGRGVVKNYDGGSGTKMGDLYDWAIPLDGTPTSSLARDYDAVIVNLGTNDFSTEPDPAESDFVGGYVKLLQKIRANSPRAQILCTVGPMLGADDLLKAEQAISKAVEARKATGDQKVLAYRMKSDNQNPGCDWHPNLLTHERMAEELTSALKTALGW